ncbi:MAG: cysteine desulfurase [Brockia lithotrophica]|nr:cysteine desulfurase [Brockia lithotrophica]
MFYLDAAATTPPWPEVVDAYARAWQERFAHPGSPHELGRRAFALLEVARRQVAELLGVEPEEVFFTNGATEANAAVLLGAASSAPEGRRHIVTTAVEHPSVLEPLARLERQGFRVTYVAPDRSGTLRARDVLAALTPETFLVSVMYVNHETGSIHPIEEIGAGLRDRPNVRFHVDAVQAAAVLSLPIRTARIDYLTLSGHKLHGPRRTGLLFVRKGLPPPRLYGDDVQEVGVLHPGTPDVAAAAAFARALRLVEERRATFVARAQALSERLREGLEARGAVVLSPRLVRAPHILNVSFPGLRGEVLVRALSAHGVYVGSAPPAGAARPVPTCSRPCGSPRNSSSGAYA